MQRSLNGAQDDKIHWLTNQDNLVGNPDRRFTPSAGPLLVRGDITVAMMVSEDTCDETEAGAEQIVSDPSNMSTIASISMHTMLLCATKTDACFYKVDMDCDAPAMVCDNIEILIRYERIGADE